MSVTLTRYRGGRLETAFFSSRLECNSSGKKETFETSFQAGGGHLMQLLRIGEEEKDSEEGGFPHKYLSFKCGIYRLYVYAMDNIFIT